MIKNDLRKLKGDKIRKSLLKALPELLLEQGLSGLTIKNLAQKALVQTGKMYYYYKTKDDIIKDATKELAHLIHKYENTSTNELKELRIAAELLLWQRENQCTQRTENIREG